MPAVKKSCERCKFANDGMCTKDFVIIHHGTASRGGRPAPLFLRGYPTYDEAMSMGSICDKDRKSFIEVKNEQTS